MTTLKNNIVYSIISVFIAILFPYALLAQENYQIVDTGQEKFYNNNTEISATVEGDNFYGQDAQFSMNSPSYTDNNDGTISDNITGLIWTKTPDLNGDGKINADDKLSYTDAIDHAKTFQIGGYNDWRLPNIKEQYSLILFTGIDPSGLDGTNTDLLTPFIDTEYFDFGFGNASKKMILVR